MSDHAVTLIVAFFSVIPSCAGAFGAFMAYRSSLLNRAELVKTKSKVVDVAEKVVVVAEKVEEVKHATNSLADRLIAAAEAAAHARGVAEGVSKAQAAADAKAISHAEGRAEEAAAQKPSP